MIYTEHWPHNSIPSHHTINSSIILLQTVQNWPQCCCTNQTSLSVPYFLPGS